MNRLSWICKQSHQNAILDTLTKAGLMIAPVTVMDKQKGSFNQVSSSSAVKNDLVINRYKPRLSFVEQLLQKAGADMERTFIKQHLGYLPIAANVERTCEMLYSKMLVYFIERDGYWFRDEAQAQEYEQRKLDPARKKTAGRGKASYSLATNAALSLRCTTSWQSASNLQRPLRRLRQSPANQRRPNPGIEAAPWRNLLASKRHWKRPDALTAEELESHRRERLLRQFNEC